MADRDSNHAAVTLALLRIGVGATLARVAWAGLSPPAPSGADLRAVVESAAASSTGAAGWWARTVLLENPEALAPLWRWGLLAVGAGLTLGVLTRPLGLVGAVLLGHAWLYGSEALTLQHGLLTLLCLAFAAARAGRWVGFDAALDATLPTWLTMIPDDRRRR